MRDFIMGCETEDQAAIAAAMYDIRANGNKDGGGRHVHGPIWEVRVDGKDVIYRVLFASVGSRGRILLSLHAFKKKTQKDSEVSHRSGTETTGGLGEARHERALTPASLYRSYPICCGI